MSDSVGELGEKLAREQVKREAHATELAESHRQAGELEELCQEMLQKMTELEAELRAERAKGVEHAAQVLRCQERTDAAEVGASLPPPDPHNPPRSHPRGPSLVGSSSGAQRAV